jgi:polyketide biosynthesis acyl carrier protein
MTKNDVFEIVKSNTLDVLTELTPDDVTLTQQLKALGANSVDRMEIVAMSMERLRIRVPMSELSGASNIEELVDMLCARCGAQP